MERKMFDPTEATISTIHNALFSRQYTCRDIILSFLSHIKRYDDKIHAILAINPDVLKIADALDRQLTETSSVGGQIDRSNFGPLFAIPILLKDNIDCPPMATTAGSLAFQHMHPQNCGPVVQSLVNAGAIIVGKANMHELALEGLTVSSLGGQTLNPYDLTRTPGGSSGGTGAAIAASMAVIGLGTDTVNSIRSPASACSLFSCRPTRGLISRAGVIPVAETQDAVGPVARNLNDLAVALTVMAGRAGGDGGDSASNSVPLECRNINYAAALATADLEKLTGIRLGIMTGLMPDESDDPEIRPVNECMARVRELITNLGGVVVDVTDATYNAPAIFHACDVQVYEINEELTGYLQSSRMTGVFPRTMAEMYQPHSEDSKARFLVIPFQHNFIREAIRSSRSDPGYARKKSNILNLTEKLQATFVQHRLDAIIYPQQKNLVVPVGSVNQHGRNGILAGVTGFPVVVVPAGFSPPSDTAPVGVPIGMEMLGTPFSEVKLLRIAKCFNDHHQVRKQPSILAGGNSTSQLKYSDEFPVVAPLANVDVTTYPLGVLS